MRAVDEKLIINELGPNSDPSNISCKPTLFVLQCVPTAFWYWCCGIASFPGHTQLSVAYSTVSPAQLSIAYSTVSDGKLGGAWERGYCGMERVLLVKTILAAILQETGSSGLGMRLNKYIRTAVMHSICRPYRLCTIFL